MKWLLQFAGEWFLLCLEAAFVFLLVITGITFKLVQYALFGDWVHRLGAWSGIAASVALYWIFKQPVFIHHGIPIAAFAFFGGLTLFLYKLKHPAK